MSAKSKSKPARGTQRLAIAASLPAGCEVLLGRAEVCAALGLSLRSFQAMRAAKEFPVEDTHIGNRPRWRVATLNEWVRARCGKGEGDGGS